MKKYYDYYFEDLETGEEFFVELDVLNIQKAYQEAYLYFLEPRFICMVDEATAEAMGLDTY